ncbi:MAG: transketolase [Nocardiopsis sp. BM-2018]|nr:MAG: transketolase [Nocardiopsis sp. BM-2018]
MPDSQPQDPTLTRRSVNAIRALTIDATQASGDGHPGMPMGAATMGYLLYRHVMRHAPSDPAWWDRDRYVQSAGHGSMLQYALLHLTGYDVSMDDLRGYRQWESITPGHPEVGHTPGVETTTGPLGQGISTAVGMAIAEAHLAARYNRPGHEVVDHRTYVIASDGDMMEGVASEASSLAGHLGLGKLIVLYDDNQITIDGSTEMAFTEDVAARYAAYGWHVQSIDDGNDLPALQAAVTAAQAETERPSLIKVRTVIGYGSPNLAGTSKIHGSVLGDDEAVATKRALDIDWPAFTVPDDVLEHYREQVERGKAEREAWRERYEAYRTAHPELAEEFERVMRRALPGGAFDELPRWAPSDKPLATRAASGKTLAVLAKRVPELVGGSADLAGSNVTDLPGEEAMRAGAMAGRIMRFGVREHAMAAIGNGMALHGGVRPFVATFLVFADYLRPSLRLSALMGTALTYVFTHDSIGLGGDGPTHQPVETLMSLRSLPNMVLLRPADGNETAQAWRLALERTEGPTALALTRQGVPHLEVPEGSVARGAYVLSEAEGGDPEVVLIGTGSEVSVCLAAQERLAQEGVRARVVSMPSFELFAAQDEAYRKRVLPPSLRARVAVEAGATLGWERFVGDAGAIVGVDRFGASAPGDEVLRQYGFTPERVAETARGVLKRVRAG